MEPIMITFDEFWKGYEDFYRDNHGRHIIKSVAVAMEEAWLEVKKRAAALARSQIRANADPACNETAENIARLIEGRTDTTSEFIF
jgi:hypothetical protein